MFFHFYDSDLTVAENLTLAMPMWFVTFFASIVLALSFWFGFFFITAISFVLFFSGFAAMFFVGMPLPSPLASATGQDRYDDD